MRHPLVAIAALAPLLCAATGDVSRFRPPPAHDGLLGVEGAPVLYPLQYAAGATLSYARNPVVWRYQDGTYEPVVGQQLGLDLSFAIGLLPLFDLGVVVPVTLLQRGPKSSLRGLDAVEQVTSVGGTLMGDVRLQPRLALMQERSWGFGLAVISEITLPTGDQRRFVGDSGFSWRPRLVGSVPIVGLPLKVSASLGYRLRKNVLLAGIESADELDFGVGGSYALSDNLAALVELSGNTSATHPFSGGGLSALEVRGGMRTRVARNVVLDGGAGVGLTQGLGTPDYRLFLGFAYAPEPPDRDGDGIPDAADACPDNPEDYDRFQDLDGCPDVDNDEDGILDVDDLCPNEPEDQNGTADDDGCPEGGLSDRDHDGIPDERDQCPDDPEDLDGVKDTDGCPDGDMDQDGIPDEDDQCPEEKETINGVDDWDGCPDEGEGDTEYIENVKIEIKATILFETGKATIKDESKKILDQVALQVLAHPEIKKVRVEGHTDSVGSDEDNLYLSQDRADSVRRYLISRGVAKERLMAVGYGETRPIADNRTAAGRAKNRRVEFLIVQ